jgi:hypothetical protein
MSFGQLTIDAGKDTTYCTDINVIPMGLNVSVKNGIEPYTFAWECNVIPYGILSPLTASDILNDTTLLSPTINNGIWLSTDKITFILNVTDHNGNSAKDSIHVGFSNYACVLGYQVIEISKGDSIWFDAGTPSGDILAYHWEPAYGLSNPDSSATWCKPKVTTNYYLARVDKFGCICSCHAYEIRVSQSLNLLNSGNIWHEIVRTSQNFDCCTYTNSYKFSGDTVIQSVAYKKLLESKDSIPNHWRTIGYAREDLEKGIYLGLVSNTWKEYLLYDYNLELNDTVKIPSLYGPQDSSYYIVSNIEDVLIAGIVRKKYLLVYPEYSNFTETWIEGIGSLSGILRTGFNCLCKSNTLLCCTNGDDLIYKNPEYDRCYYSVNPTVGFNTFQSNQFKVIQGFSNQQIILQFPDAKPRDISVFNSAGVLVDAINASEAVELLNISNYQAGLYLVVSIGEQAKGQKFIKY